MDIMQAIRYRRSVRRFSERVPEERLVLMLVEAATRAPTAGNTQPWHFYIVWDLDTRRCLSYAANSQRHVAAAPVVIVVCADPGISRNRYGRRGADLYYIQDAAAATENLLLAAAGNGLGGCWVGAFDEKAVAKCIDLPRRFRPLALVPLGYPSAQKQAIERKDLDQVMTVIK